ncbi:hypothetical protein DICSQDRAFT_47682 [Dichomitus squalens LYAD-421 SS1]|uniref:uncharacterized protein n=1 Tax=Dichomitus squalens (strain LYAD-421) TaxID=732165 RepID=UPI00044107CC|nr:uncharacterized protein DICSQDRAFT_47682 [Dichomitus squalens LYAD-421 SS1]EJF66904.1 hypothetical protein DICSQDRAFT_47682 [Dichomitus squalens LYAD-421 SS1]
MPQEFNLTAARNETDSRLAHAAAATYPGVNGTDAAAAAAGADDAALVPRDVWSPEIFSPNARDVWTAGSTVAVRWDTADPPGEVTSYAGRVLLGRSSVTDVCAEHPLAEGFNLTQGSVKVKVPAVKPSNHYFVVLIGDSGNRSPSFTILGRPLVDW